MVLSVIKHGCLYSLDWTTGLDYWTGLLDCHFYGFTMIFMIIILSIIKYLHCHISIAHDYYSYAYNYSNMHIILHVYAIRSW